jgi:hypothetical protein
MLGSLKWALEALFCSATLMKKQIAYSESSRNSATFEYKVDLFLSRSPGTPPGTDSNAVSACQIRTVSKSMPTPPLEALFCSATLMKKHRAYSESSRNSATFEYKVDLFLSRSPGTPPGTDSNAASANSPCLVLRAH